MPPIIRSLRAQRLEETREEMALLTRERDEARAQARVLADAFTFSTRSNAAIAAARLALAYPVLP